MHRWCFVFVTLLGILSSNVAGFGPSRPLPAAEGALSTVLASSSATAAAATLDQATAVAAGDQHSLVLRNDGTVWGWGYNAAGQLGDGAAGGPTPTRVGNLAQVNAIAAGGSRSLALRDDGTVWTWGDGRPTPTPVAGLIDVAAIASGAGNNLALTRDGSVVTWAWAGTPTPVIGLTGIVALAAGQEHSLALKEDGTVWAWGANYYGQLGDGTRTSRATPAPVSGLAQVRAIASGISHSLAVKDDGTVWAWGYNGFGQLGDGTGTDRLAPVRVAGLTATRGVSAGGWHSVALMADGRLHSWGYNQHGQVGNGVASGYAGPWPATPVAVLGITDVSTLAAGGQHTLALTGDGRVWSWGADFLGQLGRGLPLAETPAPVGALVGVRAISAATWHSSALLTDGTVWTWGVNGAGELDGIVASQSRPTPARVEGLPPIEAISAGGASTLALASDGAVWGWGNAIHGFAPGRIVGLPTSTAVSAGGAWSLALGHDGTVWAWGQNLQGQLGDGTTTGRWAPAPVTGLAAIDSIAAGDSHNLALRSDGTVVAWGANDYGQLGDGTRTHRLTPVPVSGLVGIGSLAAGNTVSLALKTDGTVWQWGGNQLRPVLVPGLSGIESIAAGADEWILALKTDGTVWRWGIHAPVPALVSGLAGVTAIDAGYVHVIARLSDHSVWGWGSNGWGNFHGQLGRGTFDWRSTPGSVADGRTPSPGGLSVTAILPPQGPNTGLLLTGIQGAGFAQGAQARLRRSGQPADIIGTNSFVAADGRSMTAAFNLANRAGGSWDVVVINPSGASATLPGAFTITRPLTPTKPWTIMFYLAGDSRVDQLGEIYWKPLIDYLKVHVRKQHYSIAIMYDGASVGDTRFIAIGDDVVEERLGALDEAFTASPAALEAFVRWSGERLPATRRALVVASHGNWLGVTKDDTNPPPGFNTITYAQLRPALQALRDSFGPLDVLYLHACNQASMEAGYAVRGLANYVVASEEQFIIPARGSAGDMRQLHAYVERIAGTTTALELASAMASDYASYRAKQWSPYYTISIARTDRFDALLTRLDALANRLRQSLPHGGAALLRDHVQREVQRFDTTGDNRHSVSDDELIDLYAFARLSRRW
jgi:alpha-tubulin suppressor-like RCC1 family protein